MKYHLNISKISLIKLSIPIFFANIATPLVGLIDTGLMGHLGSINFLTATSISTAVITMLFWSFGFLRMGTVGLISQALGKGDYREIVLTLLRNSSLAVLISIIIILFQYPLILLIEHFFNPSISTQILIKKYISIRIFSAPAELIIYVLVGFYLGLQKTNISSLLVMIFCFLNILFSTFFVIQLNLDISGVALGTLVSAYITAIVYLIYTYFFIIKNFKIIPRFKNIFIKKKLIKLFSININIFIRTVLLTFAFLWITYQSSKLGEDYVAVNSILMQFILMASFFLDAYAFSTEGIVGYTIGKNNKKAFINSAKNSFELSFYTGIFISIFYLLSFKLIVDSLTTIDILRYITYEYVIWVVLIPPVASFCYQYDGIFIGASQTAEIRNAMIISVIIFIFISTWMTNYLHNHGLWLSLISFMIIRSLTLSMYFSNILKKF
jgi:MATE family multidrug resistance protein|tara:strand:+ start:1007 stop:2323 length:1317 start_codon:yes stop_codon:yes gene_type:complete